MPKIRKIGSKLYKVKELEGKETLEEIGDVEAGDVEVADDTTPNPADVTDADKDEIKSTAGEIAKQIMSSLNLKGNESSKEVKDLNEKVNKLLDNQFGNDSKLKMILNGKDVNSKELTKEEKIVGFYYGLVTNNLNVVKALSEGTDADGGYLFPNEFSTELIKELPNINVMRNEVRIIQMKRDKMDITKLVAGPQLSWTAEKATISTTTATFDTVMLTVFKLAGIIYSSDEVIDDSDIHAVVPLIIEQFSNAIAEEEERVIWNGNGTTQPQGIAQATIAGITGTGNIVNDLNKLFYSLPARYRPQAKFYSNSDTQGDLNGVVDTQGRPLMTASITDPSASQIKGKTVVVSEHVPDNSLYFGDLKKAYFLGDRQRMSVKISQDTETAFTKGETAIRVIHRVAGKLVFASAVRKLTAIV